MSETNELVRATEERVRQYGREVFGEMLKEPEEGRFGVVNGSALVNLRVMPWGDDDTVVRVWSWVVTDIEMTSDLMQYLLTQNYKMRFGAFGVDDDGDITFEYAIVGSTLDKEELRAALVAVAFTADHEDDAIRERWGGRRAADRAAD